MALRLTQYTEGPHCGFRARLRGYDRCDGCFTFVQGGADYCADCYKRHVELNWGYESSGQQLVYPDRDAKDTENRCRCSYCADQRADEIARAQALSPTGRRPCPGRLSLRTIEKAQQDPVPRPKRPLSKKPEMAHRAAQIARAEQRYGRLMGESDKALLQRASWARTVRAQELRIGDKQVMGGKWRTLTQREVTSHRLHVVWDGTRGREERQYPLWVQLCVYR